MKKIILLFLLISSFLFTEEISYIILDSYIKNKDLVDQVYSYLEENTLEELLEIKDDYNGSNLLFSAVAWNRLKLAEMLLKKGFDPNYKNSNGDTALFECASIECIILLYHYNADINIRNKEGKTILGKYIEWNVDKDEIEKLKELGAKE